MPSASLFSAYAEVFPSPTTPTPPSRAFLCLRRGVSQRENLVSHLWTFSLPTQRCFSFESPKRDEAPAFLCLRRGVSLTGSFNPGGLGFSLPTQRCFEKGVLAADLVRLFSAYAEVFLTLGVFWKISKTFLCLRRGVSEGREALPREICFSLPTQRCFFAHYWR